MGIKGKISRVSRRLFIGGLLGSAAGHAMANAPATSLRPVPRQSDIAKRAVKPVKSLVDAAGVSGKTCFVVADARTGKVLEANNPTLPLPPASVAKTITALYALEKLGPAHRFRTQVLATGSVINGRLNGDLVLVGGGDPTLNTDALGDMAKQLKDAGVREITGKFLVYGGALPGSKQIDASQLDHVSYNPAISGLNLNFNRVHFEWKRGSNGYTLTMDARAKRYNPRVYMAKMAISGRDLPVYTYSDKGNVDSWTVARSALGNGGARWLPVRKPELYAADVFQTLARSHGLPLPNPKVVKSVPRGQVLVLHQSADLRAILRGMMKFSTNLTAEVVGLAATAAGGNKPANISASARQMTSWARSRLGMSKAKFVDHSGLGGASRITAQEMTAALVKAQKMTIIPELMKDIAMRDADGKVVKNHPVKVRAKTGTLNFVTALSGYLRTQSGQQLVFTVISGDLPRRQKIKKSDGDVPQGTRGWRKRAITLQRQLLTRWGTTPFS